MNENTTYPLTMMLDETCRRAIITTHEPRGARYWALCWIESIKDCVICICWLVNTEHGAKLEKDSVLLKHVESLQFMK